MNEKTPDQPEVTSEIPINSVKLERALVNAIGALRKNGEATSETLEDLVLLTDILTDVRKTIREAASKLSVRERLRRAGVDADRAQGTLQRIAAETGVPPGLVMQYVAGRFEAEMRDAGFDPAAIRDQIIAASDRGDTEAARGIMNRVSTAVAARKPKS